MARIGVIQGRFAKKIFEQGKQETSYIAKHQEPIYCTILVHLRSSLLLLLRTTTKYN